MLKEGLFEMIYSDPSLHRGSLIADFSINFGMRSKSHYLRTFYTRKALKHIYNMHTLVTPTYVATTNTHTNHSYTLLYVLG
jgi:hypothetical protein